jgi:hypothetical protein
MGVHVHVGDDMVDITFTGIDRCVTFCPTGRHLAMADITAANVVADKGPRQRLRFRVGGGYVPKLMTTGWYTVRGVKGARELWCVYRDHEVLVIDTRLPRPSRVVLQTPDRHDIAWYIGERLARR